MSNSDRDDQLLDEFQNTSSEEDEENLNEDKLLHGQQQQQQQQQHDEGDEDIDDDSDEDEDDYAKVLNRYFTILGNIKNDKYKYNEYLLLVETAHELSDLEKIRQSYTLFASMYPLAPDIWLKLLKTELDIATTESEMSKLVQLCKKALDDYFSFDIAILYANLTAKLPDEITNEIWNEMMSTYSLHCMKGREMFQNCRQYYLLKNVDENKLVELYETELSVPLFNMENSYIEFKLFCESRKDTVHVDWKRIDEKYNKAKEQLQKMLPFEKRLMELDAKSHAERSNIYQEYINECKHFLDDKNIQIIYERYITDCCLNVQCWLNYIKFIQTHDGYPAPPDKEQPIVFSQTDWDVVNRAIRNCPWSAEIYIEKMHIAEKMELSKEDVRSIIEVALAAGFEKPQPVVSIWLEYLSYLRRNTNYANERETTILNNTFSFAWETLGKQFGDLADRNCEILQLWSKLAYGPLNNLIKGKELWTVVMQSSDNETKSALWIEFAHLELKKGVDGARKVYRKAVSVDYIDDINTIISAWICFERCNGSLDQLILCQEQCRNILLKYNHQDSSKFNKFRKQFGQSDNKRKYVEHSDGSEPKVKHQKLNKNTKMQQKNSKGKSTTTTDHTSQFKQPSIKNTGQLDEPRGMEIDNGVDMNKQNIAKHNQLTDKHETYSIDKTKDDITIFLSNLDFDITEINIREAFPELEIKSINLIRTANGRGRGYGYVELESKSTVEKALSFDRRIINGRPTFISSVLRDKEQRGKFKYSGGIEPCKVFVKGLPITSTVDELTEIFKDFGKLKDVRLVSFRDGRPKGIAYVEYIEKASASLAVLKLDQTNVKGNVITVAISAPPPKKESVSSKPAEKQIPVKTEQKQRISFVPRSVQKNVLAAGVSSQGNGSTIIPKTNEDFRKLLNK